MSSRKSGRAAGLVPVFSSHGEELPGVTWARPRNPVDRGGGLGATPRPSALPTHTVPLVWKERRNIAPRAGVSSPDFPELGSPGAEQRSRHNHLTCRQAASTMEDTHFGGIPAQSVVLESKLPGEESVR